VVTVARFGWAFQSALSLLQMKAALDAGSDTPWTLGDSEHLGDYLGGRLTEQAVARIYVVEDGFVVNLRFTSLAGDVRLQRQDAERRLLGEILPLVLARDTTPTDPLE